MLKVVLFIQFILIIRQKQDDTGIVFLASNIVFKVSIGLFIMMFFMLHEVTEIEKLDKIIIGFAGVILIYDAVYIDLPKALAIYKINFSPYTIMRKIL